jgi:hypothetical protein
MKESLKGKKRENPKVNVPNETVEKVEAKM